MLAQVSTEASSDSEGQSSKMANGFLNALANDLAVLVDTAHRLSLGEPTFGIPTWTPRKLWYWLDEQQSLNYSGVVRRILGHKEWSEKFSEQYIRWAVKRIFDDALDNGNARIRPSLDELADQFDAYATEHLVVVPIQGLKLGLNELKVGKVVFKPVTNQYAVDLDSKHGLTPQYRLRGMDVMVCAEHTVVAEQGRAADRAEDECRRSIDVLRYWMSFCSREGVRMSVGLFPEVLDGQRTIPVTNLTTGESGIENRGVGILTEFEITDDILNHLKTVGVLDAATILEKRLDHVSEFERMLLSGLHWFGKSEVQPDQTDSFLNLTTVLEVFLTQSGAPITNQIAEGVVMFFALDVDERRKLKAEIQDLYGLRSKVSHSGSSAILMSDLFLLRRIVRDFLAAMIARRSEFTHKKALLECLETMRLR
jgi:hypothetical protein